MASDRRVTPAPIARGLVLAALAAASACSESVHHVDAVLAERDGEDLFVLWHEQGPCMEGDFARPSERPCVHSALWAILRCDE